MVHPVSAWHTHFASAIRAIQKPDSGWVKHTTLLPCAWDFSLACALPKVHSRMTGSWLSSWWRHSLAFSCKFWSNETAEILLRQMSWVGNGQNRCLKFFAPHNGFHYRWPFFASISKKHSSARTRRVFVVKDLTRFCWEVFPTRTSPIFSRRSGAQILRLDERLFAPCLSGYPYRDFEPL